MRQEPRIRLHIEGLDSVNNLMKKAAKQYDEMVQTLNLITKKAAEIESELNRLISSEEGENNDGR